MGGNNSDGPDIYHCRDRALQQVSSRNEPASALQDAEGMHEKQHPASTQAKLAVQIQDRSGAQGTPGALSQGVRQEILIHSSIPAVPAIQGLPCSVYFL